ncbi:MAG: hypothetical protein AB8G96_13720 [Phycisphaerales bacterium]
MNAVPPEFEFSVHAAGERWEVSTPTGPVSCATRSDAAALARTPALLDLVAGDVSIEPYRAAIEAAVRVARTNGYRSIAIDHLECRLRQGDAED